MTSSPYLWVEQARLAGSTTKFPFKATINGKPVLVWPDRTENLPDPPRNEEVQPA